MSVAFYPNKGLVCYGSEQAAVKAGLNVPFPGRSGKDPFTESKDEEEGDVLRLDLDDLNGEVVLLDWGRNNGFDNNLSNSYHTQEHPLSVPNRHLHVHQLMRGKLDVVMHHESKATTDAFNLHRRMTKLSDNPMILPLPGERKDPVLGDIEDIPRVCKRIQDEWDADKVSTTLNRLTAFNFSRCLREKLDKRIRGEVHPKATDILLTGCEVSLWLAEQFASDLQKALPNLGIKAISSNKLLGMYGQDIAVPSLGFPSAQQTDHIDDAIVIIVSHSGGTFAPLSCSNLLQVRNTEEDNDDDERLVQKNRPFVCVYVGLYCLLPTHSLTHSLIIPLHLITYRAKRRTCSL